MVADADASGSDRTGATYAEVDTVARPLAIRAGSDMTGATYAGVDRVARPLAIRAGSVSDGHTDWRPHRPETIEGDLK
jgi:hypothetical protein